MDVDQSLTPLLIACGLCNVPDHGEHCSAGAARRRRAGDVNGLSRSGVNGGVKGVIGVPLMVRANTETGVFISNVGLGLIGSSVPEVSFKESHTKTVKGAKDKLLRCYLNITPDVSDDVFLSLPVDSNLALPLVATES